MDNPFEFLNGRINDLEVILLQIKNAPLELQKTADNEELFTVKEAATFLSLSVPTIYGLIHKGVLPVMKRSKHCYFLKTDLINYLKAGRRKSYDEIKLETETLIITKKNKK